MDAQQQSTTLAQAVSMTPEAMAALMNLGYSFYQQGKLDQAINVFEGLIVLDSSNPYAHAMLGSLNQQMNFNENAIKSYSNALQLYSGDICTLANRGECYLHLGKFEEAARDFKAAILLDPEETNQAANRARFLSVVTLEALKLAQEGGTQAVVDAKLRLDEQLKQP